MKIIEIIPSLESGGAERFVVDLCNELSKKSEVTLVVFAPLDNNNNSFYDSELYKDVNVISLNMKNKVDLSIFFKLHSIIKKLQPDVIHSHITSITYLPLTLFLYRKAVYVHTVHNDAKMEAGNHLYSKILRRFIFDNHMVAPVTISKESLRSFKDYYGFSTYMIYNGRDVVRNNNVPANLVKEFEKYRKAENTRIVTCIARMAPQKRLDMLVRVVKQLEEEGFDLKLLIIGKKDSEIATKITSMNCKSVEILGEKHNPLDYLQMSDAFALSSFHEGMPISFIEALGMGCIPICTPVGGIKDVLVNNINGFMSEDISEESYTIIFKQFLLSSVDKLEQIKTAALESYKQFSMATCAENYLTLFSKLTKEYH